MLFCNLLLFVNVWFLLTNQEVDTFGLDLEPASFGAFWKDLLWNPCPESRLNTSKTPSVHIEWFGLDYGPWTGSEYRVPSKRCLVRFLQRRSGSVTIGMKFFSSPRAFPWSNLRANDMATASLRACKGSTMKLPIFLNSRVLHSVELN